MQIHNMCTCVWDETSLKACFRPRMLPFDFSKKAFRHFQQSLNSLTSTITVLLNDCIIASLNEAKDRLSSANLSRTLNDAEWAKHARPRCSKKLQLRVLTVALYNALSNSTSRLQIYFFRKFGFGFDTDNF